MSATCSVHAYHWPRMRTPPEYHHVIPQAWQKVWRPGEDPHDADQLRMEATRMLGKLWAPDTVPLCPTGHANVHALIVTMMKALKEHIADGGRGAGALTARKLVGVRAKEAEVAYLALARWEDAGGSLRALIEAGQYGRGIRVPGR